MRRRQTKTSRDSSRDIHDEGGASADVPEPHLAKPSWRWRLLLGMAIVCAVVGVTVAAVPELLLSAVQVTAPHLHP